MGRKVDMMPIEEGDRPKTCPICSESVPMGAAFCPKCGARLTKGISEEVNPAVMDLIAQFERRVRNNPKDAAAYYNLALAYITAQRWGAAVQALERLRELEPDYIDGLFQLVRAYIRIGNVDAAEHIAMHMTNVAPKDHKTERARRLIRRARKPKLRKV